MKRGGKPNAPGTNPENFRAFVDHSPAIAFLKDADSRLVYVNHAYERAFQRPAEKLIGTADVDRWPAEFAVRLRANDLKVLQTGEPTEAVEQVPLPDGRLRTWFSIKFRVTGPDGAPYVGGMAVDITDREAAEKALAAERSLLRTLIDNIPDLVYVKDRDHRFILANQSLAKLMGAAQPEQILGKADTDIFPVDVAERYAGDERQVMESGQPLLGHEEQVISADGQEFWYSTSKVVLHDPDGKPAGIVGIGRDITAGHQALQALQRSEGMFRHLFEQSPDAIFVEDLDGNVLDVNSAGCDLHGMKRADLIGKNVMELVPAGDREGVKHSFPLLPHLGRRPLEGRSVHSDGRVIPVELQASRIEYDGQPAMLLHVRDISARKAVEAALLESQSKYRRLVERLPAVTYMAELDSGRWYYVSPQIETLLGFSVQEWTADKCPWLDHIHPDDRPQVLAAEARCRENGEEFFAEYRMVARNGRVVWFSDRAVVIRDAAGHPQHLHGVMFDISGRKSLEEQLTQAHKMDAIGRLAGGVAHDFNNILTAILGYSELILRRNEGDTRTRENAQEIKKSAERAASLTRQLLAFSRKQTLQPQVLDLNSVVTEMDKMLRRLIGETIYLEWHPAKDLWCAKADPGQVQQVIMNLAVNGRDAMPQGGTLTVETSNVVLDENYVRNHPDAHAGEHVMLAVSDTGLGLSDEAREHLFEPFFTTKELGNGTGLGLATVYGIIKQSGGHIHVYSERNRGTSFKVYLPRVQATAEAAPATETSTATPGGRERVLLVEDEEPVRELSACVLRELGYTVVEACDGDEALRLTKEMPGQSFDLLFTDVVMPRMGGKELAYWFRVTHPKTRVLFTSGYPDKSVVHNGELLAGIAFLHKPYTPQSLAHKIRAVLDN